MSQGNPKGVNGLDVFGSGNLITGICGGQDATTLVAEFGNPVVLGRLDGTAEVVPRSGRTVCVTGMHRSGTSFTAHASSSSASPWVRRPSHEAGPGQPRRILGKP